LEKTSHINENLYRISLITAVIFGLLVLHWPLFETVASYEYNQKMAAVNGSRRYT